MKVHNFVEDSEDKYFRTVFCRRCGQVAWFYNVLLDKNIEIQNRIQPCVEQEVNNNLKGGNK